MHAATVGVVRNPPHVSPCGEAVSQADGTVWPDLQAVGQLSDQDLVAAREPLDGQQGLMLLGRKALRPRGLFAEMQELAQRPTEIREQLVFGFGDAGWSRGHAGERQDKGRLHRVNWFCGLQLYRTAI